LARRILNGEQSCRATAHLPLFREVRISPNEHETLQTDIPAEKFPNKGWVAASPETAGSFSAIGYAFGSRTVAGAGVPDETSDLQRTADVNDC